MIVIAEERPRARKYHPCDHCQCDIAPGETYQRTRYVYDGTPGVWKAHEDCAELAHEIWLESGLWPDEGIRLCDEERDVLATWRGTYPHAVCRVELGWELAQMRRLKERRER